MNKAHEISDPGTPRLSTLAVVSMGGALLSVGACVLAALASILGFPTVGLVIMGLPAIALASALAGLLAMQRIGRSDGLLVGGVPARLGLVLGLIATAITGAFTVGALRTAYDVRTTLAPVVDALLADANAGDWDAALERLSEPVAADLGETGLRAHVEALERAFGGRAVNADVPLIIVFQSRGELVRASDPTKVNPSPQNITDEVPKPVRVTFDNGASCVTFVFLDQDALTLGEVRVADSLTVLPDNRVLTLQRDGPARLLALAGGMTLVEP